MPGKYYRLTQLLAPYGINSARDLAQPSLISGTSISATQIPPGASTNLGKTYQFGSYVPVPTLATVEGWASVWNSAHPLANPALYTSFVMTTLPGLSTNIGLNRLYVGDHWLFEMTVGPVDPAIVFGRPAHSLSAYMNGPIVALAVPDPTTTELMEAEQVVLELAATCVQLAL